MSQRFLSDSHMTAGRRRSLGVHILTSDMSIVAYWKHSDTSSWSPPLVKRAPANRLPTATS